MKQNKVLKLKINLSGYQQKYLENCFKLQDLFRKIYVDDWNSGERDLSVSSFKLRHPELNDYKVDSFIFSFNKQQMNKAKYVRVKKELKSQYIQRLKEKSKEVGGDLTKQEKEELKLTQEEINFIRNNIQLEYRKSKDVFSVNPQRTRFDGNYVEYIPFKRYCKESRIKLRNWYKLTKNLKNVKPLSIKFVKDRKFYVYITVEYEVDSKEIITKIGLDPGMSNDNTVTLSNGEKFVLNTSKINKKENRLSSLQSKYDRFYRVYDEEGKPICFKKCNNQKKLLAKINKLRKHLYNSKTDRINKFVKELVTKFDFIADERTNVKQLSSLNAKRYTGGARMVQRSCIGLIKSKISHKANEFGKQYYVVKQKRFPSSNICNSCGYKNMLKDVSEKLGINQIHVREGYCPKCNSYFDRDVNAAKNILNQVILEQF